MSSQYLKVHEKKGTQWNRGGEKIAETVTSGCQPHGLEGGETGQAPAEEDWKARTKVEEEAEEKNIRVVEKRTTQWKTGGGICFPIFFANLG